MKLDFRTIAEAATAAFRGNLAAKDELAAALSADREAMDAFEKAYAARTIADDASDPFAVDAKRAAREAKAVDAGRGPDADGVDAEAFEKLKSRIVGELLSCVEKGVPSLPLPGGGADDLVTNADLRAFPERIRPQLAGSLVKKDLGGPPSCYALYDAYLRYVNEKDAAKKKAWHDRFRQGLDILDLDEITYEALGRNPNSIGHWFPTLEKAAAEQGFFKVPKTKIVKVPLPILQLSRIGYETLSPATLEIVDRWAFEAFGLDETKEYFVKTGTFSSKFNFRNCVVRGAKEVRELGEYLLYMQSVACEMAAPLSSPSIYGASTTNEWCVREFIADSEGNPTIYEGLPLRTEFRAFVDFDADELLGICPYWRPDVMKKRFSSGPDADDPRRVHDYVVYAAHEKTLMERYEKNVGKVTEAIRELVPLADLRGQWSFDVMMDGDDFWAIDMSLAANSALRDCVPAGKLAPCPEPEWFPIAARSTNGKQARPRLWLPGAAQKN